MKDKLRKLLADEKLKGKITFTLLMLLVCRVGAHIPVPGINTSQAIQLLKSFTGGSQNLFQLMDVFTGGAFAQMTVIALGVMPYISSSIILQVLVAIIPSFQREMKENPTVGKRKMSKWTRVLTLGLAFFQAGIFAKYTLQLNASSPGIILPEVLSVTAFGVPWLFFLLFMATMTCGTVLLMWVGEQITERGIGNGISMIISLGILSSLPKTFGTIIRQLNLESQVPGQMTFTSLLLLGSIFVMIIVGTILINQGQLRIPVSYARRVVGKMETQGGHTYIPLKINHAGVIPVIFASSVLMFPATIGKFLGQASIFGKMANALVPGHWFYTCAFVGLIFFFTYFWTATQFRPDQIASDLKRGGAFIPGVRHGQPTQQYLEMKMNRITFAGASFLALIAVLPTLVGKLLTVDASITYFFGGTSLLILVSVVLDTASQIKVSTLGSKYQGFMKGNKMRIR